MNPLPGKLGLESRPWSIDQGLFMDSDIYGHISLQCIKLIVLHGGCQNWMTVFFSGILILLYHDFAIFIRLWHWHVAPYLMWFISRVIWIRIYMLCALLGIWRILMLKIILCTFHRVIYILCWNWDITSCRGLRLLSYPLLQCRR